MINDSYIVSVVCLSLTPFSLEVNGHIRWLVNVKKKKRFNETLAMHLLMNTSENHLMKVFSCILEVERLNGQQILGTVQNKKKTTRWKQFANT